MMKCRVCGMRVKKVGYGPFERDTYIHVFGKNNHYIYMGHKVKFKKVKNART